MLGDLGIGEFSGGDVEHCAGQSAESSAVAIPHRKTVSPHPANLSVGPDDAEFLVEMSGLGGLFELREHVDAVLGIYQFGVRGWMSHEALNRTTGDGFVCETDLKNFLGRSVQEPEDLLDVVRHLLQAFLV